MNQVLNQVNCGSREQFEVPQTADYRCPETERVFPFPEDNSIEMLVQEQIQDPSTARFHQNNAVAQTPIETSLPTEFQSSSENPFEDYSIDDSLNIPQAGNYFIPSRSCS